MTNPLHALDDFDEDNGFDVAICDCGWIGPPCPDTVTAANFWGQHLLAVKHTGAVQITVDPPRRDDGFAAGLARGYEEGRRRG